MQRATTALKMRMPSAVEDGEEVKEEWREGEWDVEAFHVAR